MLVWNSRRKNQNSFLEALRITFFGRDWNVSRYVPGMSLDSLRNKLRNFLMKFWPCSFHFFSDIQSLLSKANHKKRDSFDLFNFMTWHENQALTVGIYLLMKFNDRTSPWSRTSFVYMYQNIRFQLEALCKVEVSVSSTTSPFKLNIFIKNTLRAKGYFTVNCNFSRNQKSWQKPNVLLVTSY